jgi:4-amino-4-deoxy-L-arabinose transferase-like glycosyltransferase
MSRRLSRLNIGKYEGFLLLVWLSVNVFFLVHRGIYLEGESEKYIRQAHLLVQTGRLESPNFRLYLTQIALIACCIRLHLGFALVVSLQLLLNLSAMVSFNRAILYVFKNKTAAFAGTLLLLLDFPYQEFNSFLYTESIFYSLTVILSCYLIRIRHLTARHALTLFALLTLICFTRPTGLLFVPPVLLYLFLVFVKKMPAPKRLALFATLIIGFLVLLNFALGSGGEFDFLLPFREEHVICGVPTASGTMTAASFANDNSLYGLLSYIAGHPAQSIRLAARRTVAFFGVFRSYYSPLHNLWLVAYFSCIDLAALLGIGYWMKNDRPVFYYFLSVLAMVWMTVMMTCDDWHNRFYLGITPFLIFLGMPVYSRLSTGLNRSFLRRKNRSK